MVALPREAVSAATQADTDTLAREYVQAFRNGQAEQALKTRPASFGVWESPIAAIENVHFRSHGDMKAVNGAIDTLCKANDALATLLRPEPTLDDIEIAEEPSDMPPLPASVQLPPTLARGACRWLDTYVDFSRKASPEAYDDYHVFCGLWVLSTVSARRVYLQLRRKKIYGNVMIALCGRSSLFAKSTTASVAKDVLYEAYLSHLIGPDRTSPSKLLSNMSGSRVPVDFGDWSIENQEFFKKKLALSGQRGLIFDEFGKFVQGMLRKGSTTSDFAEIFLSLDACPPTYGQDTHARNAEPIQKPFLSLLGAMTPANLKENAKSGADFWTDGFWARFSFVAAPSDAAEDNPLTPDELPVPDELVSALKQWHQDLGVPFADVEEMTDEKGERTGKYRIVRDELPETACSISQEAWQAWKTYRSALKAMTKKFGHDDFDASYQRLSETALRIAVLIASLENDGRIELRHWAKAQELAELLRKNLHELYRQVNRNDYQSETSKLEESILNKMQTLRDKGVDGITVAQLKSRYFKNTSVKMLNDIMENMTKAGILSRKTTDHAVKGKYFLAE
jgi:hypothetical protein